MDAHIKKVYVPMTETGFYILCCLKQPNHGYGIVQRVKEITDGELILTPGTMYGTLSKMENNGFGNGSIGIRNKAYQTFVSNYERNDGNVERWGFCEQNKERV